MFCIECGKSIPENSKFCPYCGAKQREIEKRQAEIIEKAVIEEVKDGSFEKIEISDNQKNKLKIPKIYFLFFGLFLCLISSFLFISFQKAQDLSSFNEQIDLVFEGKSSISDYDIKGTKGKMFDVKMSTPTEYYLSYKLKVPEEKTVVHTSEHLIADKIRFNLDDQEWKYTSGLVEYFEAEQFTGFSTYHLTKNSKTFSMTYSWSGDMAYRIKEFKIIPGFRGSYFSVPDAKTPTYRTPIHIAYENAAKFLTVKNTDNSYSQGSFSKISDFPYMKSEFHMLEQEFPKYFYAMDTIFAQYPDYTGHRINNDKISKNTSRSDANVFTEDWIVWYKSYTNRYFISELSDVFYKKILVYFLVSSSLLTLGFYLFINRKRIKVI